MDQLPLHVSLQARLAGRRDHLVPHRHNKQRQQCHRNRIVKHYSRGQAMRDISINEILHSKGLFDFMGFGYGISIFDILLFDINVSIHFGKIQFSATAEIKVLKQNSVL